MIRAGEFPKPFESETPAIDLFLEEDEEDGKIDRELIYLRCGFSKPLLWFCP